MNRFVYALVLIAVWGQNQLAPAASPAVAAAAATQIQKNPGDAQIEHSLKTRLAKSKMSADHFTFSVAKGVVTIDGSTSVMQHKGAMTRMAKASGASSVHNNIRVSDAARAKATAALARKRTSTSGTTLARSTSAVTPAKTSSSTATSGNTSLSTKGTARPAAVSDAPAPHAVVLPAGSAK